MILPAILKKQLREHSVSDLMVIKSGGGRKRKTAGIEKEILAEQEAGNYSTRQEIADMIEDKFHIKVSRLWLKCGSLPAKADTEKQKTFFDTILNPLMKKAEGGELSLLFLDTSHFVMGGLSWAYLRQSAALCQDLFWTQALPCPWRFGLCLKKNVCCYQ